MSTLIKKDTAVPLYLDAKGNVNRVVNVMKLYRMLAGSNYNATGYGSAAAPDIAFRASTNSGFFLKSNNTIGISVNGVEIGYMDNQGIHLDNGYSYYGTVNGLIASDINATPLTNLERDSNGNGRVVSVWANDGSSTAPALSFLNEAGLGIYKSGVNELSICANGTQIIKFTPTLITQVAGSFSGSGTVGAAIISSGGGSLANPGYSFNTDNASGLTYSASPLKVSCVINGTEVGYFDSTGIHSATISSTASQNSYTFPGSVGPGVCGIRYGSGTNNVNMVSNGTNIALFNSSGLVLLADGSAGNPIINWNAATNSGVFRSNSTGAVHIAAAGTDTLAANTDGSVTVNNGLTTTAGDISSGGNVYATTLGSTSTMSFGLSGTKNTGMWFPGTNKLTLNCNGVGNLSCTDTAGVYFDRTTNISNYATYKAPVWCYLEGSQSNTVNRASTDFSASFTIQFGRMNNRAWMFVPVWSITTSTSGLLNFTTALPAQLWPSSTQAMPCIIQSTLAYYQVTSAGAVNIIQNGGVSSWGSGTTTTGTGQLVQWYCN